MESIVQCCNRCREVDPSPVRWDSRSLEVDEDWLRLSVDVTHVPKVGASRPIPCLTVVDCGPSRIAVWRRI